MSLGLLGFKRGMTQINDEKKGRVAVTLIETGPCLVMQKKTIEKDGYTALQLGFGSRKESRTSKAQKVKFDKLNSKPKRFVREFRVDGETLGKFQEGQEIKLSDVFAVGQKVDITGQTKGRGFTGVMKRWNFSGFDAGHGTHEFFRHGGSIGCRAWPGTVMKGKKMGGHYGDEKVTTQNLTIVQIAEEENCIMVTGSVPGFTNGLVTLNPAIKVKAKKRNA
jgi:large subunit ribosomal protein L3